jgi:hypothetical protein
MGYAKHSMAAAGEKDPTNVATGQNDLKAVIRNHHR